jgi:crotonobetainyl-CoA:carnitine CoA-transferase CaiB-like acyl-CoA transferase
VEVSLLRTGAYVLGWDLGIQMALGKVAGSEPRHRNQAPLMNPYRAADGCWFFFTGLETARHLPAVCRALGRPDLLEDPRFADAAAIRRHRTEVIALLDEIVAARPLADWAERFEREGVWWAPAHGPADVVADPQLAANDGFVQLATGAPGSDDAASATGAAATDRAVSAADAVGAAGAAGGPGGDGVGLRSVNGPVTFSGVAAPHGARVPAVGQHTAEVLAELAEASERSETAERRRDMSGTPREAAP